MSQHAVKPLLLVLLLGTQSPPARAADLAGPQPPESVLLFTGKEKTSNDRLQTYLSKRNHDEVRAFYGRTCEPFEKDPEAPHGIRSRVLFTYQQTVDILMQRHRDLTLADDVRLQIRWNEIDPARPECTSDFFTSLMMIARLKKRQAEFDALCKRYGYLDTAIFQNTVDHGKVTSMDKVILARHRQQHGGKQTKALASEEMRQMTQRMQELAMSGRQAEAAELARQIQGRAGQANAAVTDWDGEVKLLQELDEVAYRTAVKIPLHPGSW